MKNRWKRVLFLYCAAGALVCLVLLGRTVVLELKDLHIQQSLLEMLTQSQANDAEDAAQEESAATQEETLLANLSAIYAENQDFVGWISIADTEINYPVMHTPADEEYYLHKDFYGDYSFAGTIFASASSSFSPQSDNVILYGHNMNNGSMFADLLNYTSQEYWQTHQIIQFDTLTQAQSYEIVYTFVVDVGVDNPHFEFYNFTTAESEAAFDAFIESCAELALYDTGVTPVYGDDLLTLVTCKGYDTTQRMVVVARAVSE